MAHMAANLTQEMGARRFGRVNWLGFWTLMSREVRRFTTVWTQTLAAPIATALLFMAVFTLALGRQRGEVMGVPFGQFLVPGILMMTVIQNSFANTSSSIMISKIQGNIIDTLMPPLSAGEILAGYVIGGAVRGMMVAVCVALVLFPIMGFAPVHPFWMLLFVLAGSVMLALAGAMAGIIAQKFDHMAALTNFVITPLSFLSGTFYSSEALPATFRLLMHLNPVFYLIDGARFGALGISDTTPVVGLLFVLAVNVILTLVCLRWLRSGYRLKT